MKQNTQAEKTISVRFGETVANEANTMLTASAESSVEIAQAILDKQFGNDFRDLTIPEAEYLRDNLLGDADRVSQAISPQAGRAFEKAGEKLAALIGE